MESKQRSCCEACSKIGVRILAVHPDDVFNELHGDDGGKEEYHEGRDAFECGENDTETADDEGENGRVRAPTHLKWRRKLPSAIGLPKRLFSRDAPFGRLHPCTDVLHHSVHNIVVLPIYNSLKQFSKHRVTMTEEKEIMNKNQRYYILHREECNAQRLARYHNNPVVIAKREEKERLKAEKEATKQAEKQAKKEALNLRKKTEREEKYKEKMQLALSTKKIAKKSDTSLDEFLIQNPPV